MEPTPCPRILESHLNWRMNSKMNAKHKEVIKMTVRGRKDVRGKLKIKSNVGKKKAKG